jgi:hypothetical protein
MANSWKGAARMVDDRKRGQIAQAWRERYPEPIFDPSEGPQHEGALRAWALALNLGRRWQGAPEDDPAKGELGARALRALNEFADALLTDERFSELWGVRNTRNFAFSRWADALGHPEFAAAIRASIFPRKLFPGEHVVDFDPVAGPRLSISGATPQAEMKRLEPFHKLARA